MHTALRSHRRARDLTQVELAELLDAKQVSVSSWEVGRVRPSKPMRKKLEAIFGVPVADLLANENGTAK